MLRLYTTALSANGRKVLAVSRALGLDIEVTLVNVYRGEGHSPQYLAINPSGKIPTLVDGDFTLFESNAILQYLCEAHGDSRFWSVSPRRRAQIARWLYWESAHWQPALGPVLAPWVGHRLRPDAVPAPDGEPDWNAGALRPLFAMLNDTLGRSRFLVGEEPTLADFAVAGMVTYFPATGFPFEKHANFKDWYGRIESLDAWRDTQEPLWTADGKD